MNEKISKSQQKHNQFNSFMLTGNAYPLRFRTEEDGLLYLECYQTGKTFPKNKYIPSHILIGGKSKKNPEYESAPIEMSYLSGPSLERKI